MDTDKIRVLLDVLDCGSLAGAAARLDYTTSGVSRMMASLEAETGFPLLLRGRGGVQATEDCLSLLPQFRELVRSAERCAGAAAEVRGLLSGRVTAGTAYYACYGWLAGMIAGFREQHPGVTVSVLGENSSRLYAEMARQQADLCIVSRREGRVRWIPVLSDPVVAWVPASDPLAAGPAFPLHGFETRPFVQIFPGEDTDNSRLLDCHHIRPNVRFTTSDTAAAYAIVEAGLGVSLNNSIDSKRYSGGVRVLPLDPPCSVEIGMIYPAEQDLSPAVRAFVACARSQTAALRDQIG